MNAPYDMNSDTGMVTSSTGVGMGNLFKALLRDGMQRYVPLFVRTKAISAKNPTKRTKRP
jgi:hypothetical protein